MYAVIETGGKQYKVAEGDVIEVELLDVKPAAKKIDFDKVLLISEGEKGSIGTPYIEGAKVTAKFAENAEEAVIKGKKLYPMKFRKRKDSQRKMGHRQKYLQVTIDKIKA